ncbi:MAG TPA: c-type cytochrome [Longimicrobiales bacterium]
MRMGLVVLSVVVAACSNGVGAPVVTVPGGDSERGKELVEVYACGSCHVVPRVIGADSKVGPPLTGFAQRAYIAGELPNNAQNLIRWIVNPRAIEPNTAMPPMGVTVPEARDLAAFLYTLK